MKLIVNIPAYNEAADIGKTIKNIKKSFDLDFYSKEGAVISEKLIQVVDDGSSDRTAEVAKENGADIIISYKPNRRLAYAFKQAIESSLKNDADFMVNIDADGQFNPDDIPKLLLPVLKEEADIVIADRFGRHKAKNIPWVRSFFNRFAASIISFFLNYKTNDLTCGFRAHNREAMLRLNLTNVYFTYTQETIIDAIGKNLKLKWVPVVVTYFDNREAKITKSIFKFINNSFKIILKAIRDVRPLKFFGWPGIFLITLGVIGFGIFLFHYFLTLKISPYLNYIIFSAISTILGIQLVVFALIADMIKSSRQLTEELFYQWKKDKYNNK
jgi:glycosyltransferase involved in cell wall biosynthesis